MHVLNQSITNLMAHLLFNFLAFLETKRLIELSLDSEFCSKTQEVLNLKPSFVKSQMSYFNEQLNLSLVQINK
ncbi:hypothetical protein BpHYR1_022492 [Brachionus plicatilis]|uniref:Uncharacterized protein n=1 Tax=Brachionus plicatilis TaxID=10195 RepID=A0A3M7PKI7_BRAPC|nr:hypothetical protein BpHYR1_022492 [Brachionus plicatilis]